MPEQRPWEDHSRTLTDLLGFTEAVTAKLHGLPDEAAVYRTVVQEFSRSNRYDVTILLLTDDGTALRLAQTSLSPERAQALAGIVRQAQTPTPHSPEHEQAPTSAADTVGAPLAVPEVRLDGSVLYQQVVRGGWTLHARGREVLSDLLSPPLPNLITERLGYAQSWFALTPLRRRGRIVGILAASRDDETQLWADAIRLLSQHISVALDRIDGEVRRRALEEELWRTEERFRALIERSSDCKMVLDGDGIVGYVSPSTERLLGREHEECIGKAALAFVCPEDVPRVRAAATQVLEHPQTAISGEVRFLHQDGSQRICEITATNLLDDPAVGGIVLNAHDITKRRQTEEELRATRQRFYRMAEVIPVGLWMLTPDWGQMLYVSPSAAKISGLSCEDLCRQPDLWRSNIHADDRQRMGAFWDERHGQSYEVEYRIVRPDGDIRWVREVTAPIRDDNGELTLLTGIVEDITEHQRAEAQLLQATKLACLGQLAGGIAHELRNPLAIISVNTELLTDSCNDPRLLRQCARRISAAIQRASQVIENLLSFANPKNGRVEQVDLGSTFETALVLLHDHLALQRARLRRDIPSDLPPVQGNPQLLQLVFTNMVLCACNAMPLGGLLVVTMRPDDKDGVVISFRDNGHGMTPEQLRDIFDPFVTFEPVGKGTGMGLAVSHSIIQQHQGSIEAQSQVGKGTTFIIRLPGTLTHA